MLAFLGIHACQGVLEGRFFGIVDDLVCGLIVTAYSFHEGLFVIFQPDTVEGYGVVRGVVRYKKGIDTILCLIFLKHTNLVFYFCAKLVKKGVIIFLYHII